MNTFDNTIRKINDLTNTKYYMEIYNLIHHSIMIKLHTRLYSDYIYSISIEKEISPNIDDLDIELVMSDEIKNQIGESYIELMTHHALYNTETGLYFKIQNYLDVMGLPIKIKSIECYYAKMMSLLDLTVEINDSSSDLKDDDEFMKRLLIFDKFLADNPLKDNMITDIETTKNIFINTLKLAHGENGIYVDELNNVRFKFDVEEFKVKLLSNICCRNVRFDDTLYDSDIFMELSFKTDNLISNIIRIHPLYEAIYEYFMYSSFLMSTVELYNGLDIDTEDMTISPYRERFIINPNLSDDNKTIFTFNIKMPKETMKEIQHKFLGY